MHGLSFFREAFRSLHCIHAFWRAYLGIGGSYRKVFQYYKRYGFLALFRKVRSIARGGPAALRRQCDADRAPVSMLSLRAGKAGAFPPPSICIHIHLFRADLAGEFLAPLRRMPFSYTLLVSVPSEKDAATAQDVFKALPLCERFVLRIAENRGRDLGPFFCAFGDEIAGHEIVGHFHAGKSPHVDAPDNLARGYLLNGLLGSSSDITKIMSLFHGDPSLGLVYPQTFQWFPFWNHHWLANRTRAGELLARMEQAVPQDDALFDFPVGSMFWARTAALRPLLDLGLRSRDFEQEAGQLDGTLAHALERLIGYVATREGFGHGVLDMPDNPQVLRWGLEQCQDMEKRLRERLEEGRIRLVVFDIFDTLLLRPLRHAEDTRKLVSARLSPEDAAVYGAWRVAAEEEARRREKKDVSSDEIFTALARLAKISPERAGAMQRMETLVEARSVSACLPVVNLMQIARERGLRVVYASDMFLHRKTILEMLRASGVPEPDHLYLSNEINRRKDTGAMQRHILETEGVRAEETLVLGDNVLSDIQISLNMGMATLPVLRMPDMLSAAPRYERLAKESFADARDSLAIGLVFRRMRQKARPLDAVAPYGFFQDFHGLGYAILGPVLTGFAAWLAGQARERGHDTLYFLARDGKIMRHAYEAWRQVTGEGPPSAYLEVSRRAVSIPAMKNAGDLANILTLPFYGSSLQTLFRERVGIDLADEEIRRLKAQKHWPNFPTPEVQDDDRLEQFRGVAETLWPRVREHALSEREAALAYLRGMGLTPDRTFAFVDVGYTGSIQRHISLLLDRQLQGYYLLTGWAMGRTGSATDGLFAYIGKDCPPWHPLMRNSFKMEKLLSADEGQVASYRRTGENSAAVCRREFSERERRYDAAREQLRAGLDAFINDAREVRETLCPGFAPTHHAATSMWLHLEGLEVLDKEFLLDDFYCAGSLI